MSNYDSNEKLKLSFAKPLNIKICTNPNYAEDTNIYSQQPQQVQHTPASQPQSVQQYPQLQQYSPYAIPVAAEPAYSARKGSASESVPTYDIIIGEQLYSNILSNVMYTMSSKNVHNKHRKVCDGVIKDCKIIRYYSDGKCLNHYILTTVGADFQRYSFYICQSEFEDKQLTNILTDKGRLHFYRQRRDIYECELIQKYILSIAEKSDVVYPEFTGWKNGKYIAAAEVIDIDTPFFKHICRSGSMSQKDAAEGVLNNLNILKKDKRGVLSRLFDEEAPHTTSWKKCKIGDFLTSRVSKQIPTEEAPLMAFTAEGGVEPKGDRYDRSFLVKDENKQYKRTEFNDFIYSSNNLDVGSIGLNKYGTAVISDVYEIFIIGEQANPSFISEAIKQPQTIYKILKYRQGVTYGQYRIYAEDFQSVDILLPSLEEQNTFALLIDRMDRYISTETVVLEKLNMLKKSLLQKMFV